MNFSSFTDFMPHGMCFSWEPLLLWLHVGSDLLIALAYFSIPMALIYFSRCGGKLPFKGIVLLFSAFILACGFTHMMSIWTIWNPDYYSAGVLKVLTALISLVTAIALWPLVRKAISLPNLFSLQDANDQLLKEVAQRKGIEADLQAEKKEVEDSLANLSRLNHLMTGRELNMVALKEEVNELCRQFGQPLRYGQTAAPKQS